MNLRECLRIIIEYYGETATEVTKRDLLDSGDLLHQDLGTGDTKAYYPDRAMQVFADMINYIATDSPTEVYVDDEKLALKAALGLYGITATENRADDRILLCNAIIAQGVLLLPQTNLVLNILFFDGVPSERVGGLVPTVTYPSLTADYELDTYSTTNPNIAFNQYIANNTGVSADVEIIVIADEGDTFTYTHWDGTTLTEDKPGTITVSVPSATVGLKPTISITLADGESFTDLMLNGREIDLELAYFAVGTVDVNHVNRWTNAGACVNTYVPAVYAATFPATFPITFVNQGVDQYGATIKTFLNVDSLAPYARCEFNATIDEVDRSNATYFNNYVKEIIDYNVGTPRRFLAKVLQKLDCEGISLMQTIYPAARGRYIMIGKQSDGSIKQIAVYSSIDAENLAKIRTALDANLTTNWSLHGRVGLSTRLADTL